MLSRRTLLQASLCGRAMFAAAEETRLVAQSYIFVQQAQGTGKTPAALVADICRVTTEAGFRNVELMSGFLEPAVRRETGARLKKYSLLAPIVYSNATLHEATSVPTAMAKVVEIAGAARDLGARAINCNPSPKPKRQRKSDDELATQAKALNQLGERLAARGLRLLIHHHDVELAEKAREWRHILANTDPAVASLCIDVEWAFVAGQDPLALLAEAGPRVASLHLRNSAGRVRTQDFGPGDIDYTKVAAWLRRQGGDPYLVVELAYGQDTRVTRSLTENLRSSRAYAEGVFGL